MANTGILDKRNATFENINEATHMSLFRRLAINHAHPTKLVFDTVGFAWTYYFLWQNNLAMTILFGVGFSALGTFLTLNANTSELATTTFGKYVIARLHPANLTLQIIGYAVSMYGVWMHQGWIILAGLSSVSFGHLWGWQRKVIP